MKTTPSNRKPGRKRKPSERKSGVVQVFVTTRQRDAIQRFAAGLGLDASPWARSVLMREVGKDATAK